MNDKAKTKRRWYQFSLRTMFVVVTLLAIPLAWAGYSLNWIRARRDVQGRGVWVGRWDCMPRTAPSGLGLLGEEGVKSVIWTPASALDLEHVRRLFPEADIVAQSEIPAVLQFPLRSRKGKGL